jgi:hypothetical protein
MNKYEPLTSRTTFGVIAFAMTIATFGLLVAAPAALATRAVDGVVATQVAPATSASPMQV